MGRAIQIARRVARHPVTHFVLLGGLLLGLSALFQRSTSGGPRGIVIDRSHIRALSRLSPAGTILTSEQLHQRVEQLIDEEILVREGMRLGLDRDDVVIRARIISKMELALTDTTSVTEPTQRDLERYVQAHREQFRQPGRIDFLHVFFRASDAGSDTARATTVMKQLQAGESAVGLGDPFVFGAVIHDRTSTMLEVEMGPAFADAVTHASLNTWLGPVRSLFGLHLVKVTAHTPDGVLPLELIADRVRSAWIAAHRDERRAAALRALRSQVNVRIDWPEELR